MPEEDFHLPDHARFQAHECGGHDAAFNRGGAATVGYSINCRCDAGAHIAKAFRRARKAAARRRSPKGLRP